MTLGDLGRHGFLGRPAADLLEKGIENNEQDDLSYGSSRTHAYDDGGGAEQG